ncbi:MAG: DEAD/DEAH box helicase [Janthinobacterium lividum]
MNSSPAILIPPAVSIPLKPRRPAPAQSLPLDRLALSPARRAVLSSLTLKSAIGFDLSQMTRGALSPGTRDDSEAEGRSTAPDALPKDDFLARLTRLLQPPLEHLTTPSGVLEWPFALLPFQITGIAALLGRPALLLADDMGLGKTIQTIAALRILFMQGEITSALIVCPASLLAQWRGEIALWAPELGVTAITGSPEARAGQWAAPRQIALVGYETLRADTEGRRDSPVLRRKWGVVVLDEASRIKNRESGVAQACRALKRQRAWALTGTPLENSRDDVASLLEFLSGDPGRDPSALLSRLRSVQLRRRKADVLAELPAKSIEEITLTLPPAQRDAYDRAEQTGIMQLAQAGTNTTAVHVFELIMRLKQLCNASPEGHSVKLDDVRERMATLSAAGHRALLFSQFTDGRFGIERAAQALRQFAPLSYTGSLSLSQRAAVADQFRADDRHKILLLSLRAGGVGLNLQEASYVFHLDRWWNPALENQADSRAHRIGQTSPVTVIRYLCADTIEERIALTLQYKNHLFRELIDDVSLDLSTAFSEPELFALFGLLPPVRV